MPDEVHCDYIIRRIDDIGHGGFGVVEKVELYTASGHIIKEYARKILRPNDSIDFGELKRRFKREVIYQTECIHNNITHIYLHNLNAEYPWFIMDLAETDLAKEITEGILSQEDKINIIKMLLDSIEYLHNRNLLHRDIKPQNILKFNNIYKISDFGLIKNIDKNNDSTQLTAIGQGMGTPRYAAPEIRVGQYTPQSDIFAIGAIIDELDINILSDIIDKCTRRRIEDRYSCINNIKVKMNEILGER